MDDDTLLELLQEQEKEETNGEEGEGEGEDNEMDDETLLELLRESEQQGETWTQEDDEEMERLETLLSELQPSKTVLPKLKHAQFYHSYDANAYTLAKEVRELDELDQIDIRLFQNKGVNRIKGTVRAITDSWFKGYRTFLVSVDLVLEGPADITEEVLLNVSMPTGSPILISTVSYDQTLGHRPIGGWFPVKSVRIWAVTTEPIPVEALERVGFATDMPVSVEEKHTEDTGLIQTKSFGSASQSDFAKNTQGYDSKAGEEKTSKDIKNVEALKPEDFNYKETTALKNFVKQ